MLFVSSLVVLVAAEGAPEELTAAPRWSDHPPAALLVAPRLPCRRPLTFGNWAKTGVGGR
jgi:hypothetical protein